MAVLHECNCITTVTVSTASPKYKRGSTFLNSCLTWYGHGLQRKLIKLQVKREHEIEKRESGATALESLQVYTFNIVHVHTPGRKNQKCSGAQGLSICRLFFYVTCGSGKSILCG